MIFELYGTSTLPSVQHTDIDVQQRARTIVVGCLQDGEEVVRLAVLREDADAPEGALLAGDMQGGVSSEVPEFQVASGLQKMLGDFRLIGDHCQVKRSLQAEEKTQTRKLLCKLGSNI